MSFIRRAQELGFSLAEIGELLTLRKDRDTTTGEVKAQAEAKITDITDRIEDLRRIRHALEHLAGQCTGSEGPTGSCPLLAELASVGGLQRTPSRKSRGQEAE